MRRSAAWRVPGPPLLPFPLAVGLVVGLDLSRPASASRGGSVSGDADGVSYFERTSCVTLRTRSSEMEAIFDEILDGVRDGLALASPVGTGDGVR